MVDATQHRALVRVVDIVLVRLFFRARADADTLYLIVSADEQIDGTVREALNRLPGIKKKPHENVQDASKRLISEMPELDGRNVVFDYEHPEFFEEKEMSPSYPGVMTVYQKTIVEGNLQDDKENEEVRMTTWRSGRRGSDKSSTKIYSWKSAEECHNLEVKLWA